MDSTTIQNTDFDKKFGQLDSSFETLTIEIDTNSDNEYKNNDYTKAINNKNNNNALKHTENTSTTHIDSITQQTAISHISTQTSHIALHTPTPTPSHPNYIPHQPTSCSTHQL